MRLPMESMAKKGEKGDGNKLTIDKDGQWLIDVNPQDGIVPKKEKLLL